MANMIAGLMRIMYDAEEPLRLTPRARRALRLLMNWDSLQNPEGWFYPKDLIPACKSESKTTDTWYELAALELIEVNKDEKNNKSRITHPTRFKLKNDKKTMRRMLIYLQQYPEFKKLLMDFAIQPPYFFIVNQKTMNEALRESDEKYEAYLKAKKEEAKTKQKNKKLIKEATK